MKCVIPVLTEGMIEVCRVCPTDPVDYLADYIFKKSNEVAKWAKFKSYKLEWWGNTLTLINYLSLYKDYYNR